MSDPYHHLSRNQLQATEEFYYNYLFNDIQSPTTSISSPVSPIANAPQYNNMFAFDTSFFQTSNCYDYMEVLSYSYEPVMMNVVDSMDSITSVMTTTTTAAINEIPIIEQRPTSDNKRKRRQSTNSVLQSLRVRPSDRQQKKRAIEKKNPGLDESVLTISQVEAELEFLSDDCSAILIMLDSLRNAFATNMNNPKSNNMAMEKEMRTAYDDLMLQVRQLEKKLDKLEEKRRKLVNN